MLYFKGFNNFFHIQHSTKNFSNTQHKFFLIQLKFVSHTTFFTQCSTTFFIHNVQLKFFMHNFFNFFSQTLGNKFFKTIEILIKIFVSVKYFLIFGWQKIARDN